MPFARPSIWRSFAFGHMATPHAQQDLIMLRHRNVYAHEHVGLLRLEVLRIGECKERVTVRYRSRLVVASSKHSTKAVDSDGEVSFGPGEAAKEISISVADDDIFGVHELRTIELVDLTPPSAARLGALTIAQIYLLDDDTYPINFGANGEDTAPSDWQLFMGFLRERWWHRSPKPAIALACRCYAAIDKVLETVLLSIVVIPRLQAYAAISAAAESPSTAGDPGSGSDAGAVAGPSSADALAAEATIATISVGSALVVSFCIRFLTSRKYLDVRGNSGTRKDLRNWLVSKLVWWGEGVRSDASQLTQMQVFNATLNGVDEAVKKIWHAHFELAANVFDLLCQLALVLALAGVSWPALLPLSKHAHPSRARALHRPSPVSNTASSNPSFHCSVLVPYLALVIWWNQANFLSRVTRRRTYEDRWVGALGDVLANWRMISCLDLRDDVASWFSRTYERFYKAHRQARFFEHDYKANLAFGGQLISSITLVATAQLCLRGALPVGAFVGLVSTMKRMTSSLPKIAAGLISLQRGVVALRVVADVINVKLGVPITHPSQGGAGPAAPERTQGMQAQHSPEVLAERSWTLQHAQQRLSHVQLVDVHFSYPVARALMDHQPHVRGLNVGLPLGNVTAVTCDMHGGTSTLLKLIAHQLSPTSGRVLVPEHLKIVMVHEQPLLFVGTLWRNLVVASEYVGAEEPEEEEVWQLARDLGLAERLVGQKDLQLGDSGQVIGATDRTLVCIVRALLARPNLLLICKPFSTLDRADSRDRLLRCLATWIAEPTDGPQPGDGRGTTRYRRAVSRRILPDWMKPRTALVGVSRQADADAFPSVATFTQDPHQGGLAKCTLVTKNAVQLLGERLGPQDSGSRFTFWPREVSA